MYYTVYKITDRKTGKIYVGAHKTNNLNDSYMGSGSEIKRQYRLRGKSDFSKEILFVYDNPIDMLNKERELVDFEFTQRHDTYNIAIGGGLYRIEGKVTVRDFSKNTWKLINCSDYDKTVHVTPHTGTLTARRLGNISFSRIPIEDYDKEVYVTPSTGNVTVWDYALNGHYQIPLSEFDETKHKKVFGGIVSEINGVRQYVSKEEFTKKRMKGCHTGKITVLNKKTGKRHHVTTEEYHRNREMYTASGEGWIAVTDVETGEKCKVTPEEYQCNKSKFKMHTTGKKTVFSLLDNKYMLIDKDNFDGSKYRNSDNKFILVFDNNGNLVDMFWDNKPKFIKKYTTSAYVAATNKTKTIQSIYPNSKKFIGYKFRCIDWKLYYRRGKVQKVTDLYLGRIDIDEFVSRRYHNSGDGE